MAAVLLPDELSELIEPLLPVAPSRPNGGRPGVFDRACLAGILFVLRSGIPWQMQGPRGRRRCRPRCVVGDRGYDAATIRYELRARGIVPLFAMRRTKHGGGLGRRRWVVERTFAWLNPFRRLRVRYDKRADIHEAFLSLSRAR